MPKFIFKIYSPYVGVDITEEVEIPDDELEGKTEDEQEQIINDYNHDWMLNTVEYGWEKIE